MMGVTMSFPGGLVRGSCSGGRDCLAYAIVFIKTINTKNRPLTSQRRAINVDVVGRYGVGHMPSPGTPPVPSLLLWGE